MKEKLYKVRVKPQMRFGKMKSFCFLVKSTKRDDAKEAAVNFMARQIKEQLGGGQLDYIKVTVIKEIKFDGILKTNKS